MSARLWDMRLLPYLSPAAFGITYLLLSFAAFPTPVSDLWRPLALVVLGSVALTALAGLLLRSASRGSLVASMVIVALSAPFLLVSVAAAAILWSAIQVLRRRWRVRTLRDLDGVQLWRFSAVFGGAFLVIGLLMAAPAFAGSVFVPQASPHRSVPLAANIYVVLLDGYPRSDTLADVYSYDNSPFTDGLESLGFEVAGHSRSNYPHTWLTLTSMLNGTYLTDLPGLKPPPESAEEQYRRLMSALNEAAAVDELRARGYRTVAIPSPFRSVALQTADSYLDSGQISAFEYSLLMHSQLAWPITTLAPDFLMGQQRDRFDATLEGLAETAAAGTGPTFVFAHLFSPPHAPLVYGKGGEHLPLPACVPDSCALWEFPPDAWDRLPDQIAYANGEILATVKRMVDSDPGATIILMSDHGSRRDRGDLDEWFHSFLAARRPGGAAFPDDISPVNVLRYLAGEDPLPYRAWMFADELRPLDLTPIEPSP